jgi:hypothetical protein
VNDWLLQGLIRKAALVLLLAGLTACDDFPAYDSIAVARSDEADSGVRILFAPCSSQRLVRVRLALPAPDVDEAGTTIWELRSIDPEGVSAESFEVGEPAPGFEETVPLRQSLPAASTFSARIRSTEVDVSVLYEFENLPQDRVETGNHEIRSEEEFSAKATETCPD